ncbi:zinc-binding alcohol dehydrogenase family protein [Granulosicoccus sp. 3-233]|uniref:zinc-binding alcohol dehydrogenase family protein n=1 Tax=Granulosicoccus sp. 3-233 TaxID=3417969 RepID=UPI003D3560CD
MRAIGYTERGAIDAASSVVEFVADKPSPGAKDLLVEVKGVSVNPVDVKVRANRQPPEGSPRILGFDASGTVVEAGSAIKQFKPGDEVFYAGDFTRPGSNAEFQLVNEKLVGRKPVSLSHAEAAGMPLTSITAWEILFDCFRLNASEGKGEALLVVGAAGGVGSMLVQLASRLTELTVIATASRDESISWVSRMGADHVIDHRKSLPEAMEALGIQPRYVASLNHTELHFPSIVDLIEPRGHITMIDDPQTLDMTLIKSKALTFSWEFMFARSMFQTQDMDAQGALLDRVSALLDEGVLVSTVNRHHGALSADTLRAALTEQERGTAIGKIVLDGFTAA